MLHRQLIDDLETAFLARGSHDDASHDIHHARRVMRSALDVARAEGSGSERIIIAAAYFHDWVNLPKNHPDRASASTLSANAARPILVGLGFHEDEIEATAHAIVAHSFSAGVAPMTLEAKALRDADRLEALGAIGLARVFFIAGQLGAGLFDSDDPFAQRRKLDDQRFAIDHFATKLLRLPTTMQTGAGRRLAGQRVDLMRDFLTALAEELRTDMPWCE